MPSEHSDTGGSSITIRPATPADADFILGLTQRFVPGGMPPWREAEPMMRFHRESTEATAADIAGPAERVGVLIAEDGAGTRIGFLRIRLEVDEFTGERQAYVADLATTARAEGTGGGRALLDAAERWARDRGCRLLAIHVFAMNARARAVYARFGFQEELLKLAKKLE